MSLIVTAYTQEGIVIGADSCITTNFTQEGKELYKHSHCGNKLFLLNKKIGISIFSNLVIVTILNQLLKAILQRPRPTEYRIVEETGYSFPSGHSMVSMAFYGYLIYLIYKYVKNKYIKWISIVLLSILVCSIGISRIYLGVHYTSDVLGGFLISMSYLVIYISAVNKFL